MRPTCCHSIEAHHSYPALHYFRRQETCFAMARIVLLVLDTASIARTALDGARFHSFVQSASIEALWGSGLRLLTGVRQIVPQRSAGADRQDRTGSSGDEELRGLAGYMAYAWSEIAPHEEQLEVVAAKRGHRSSDPATMDHKDGTMPEQQPERDAGPRLSQHWGE